jgi:bromodomain and WD repeat domain-containing protein 1/3
MICAAFSPGGLFLATGSADHHVRVYMMDGKVRGRETERELLETSSECDHSMDVCGASKSRAFIQDKKSE